MIAMKKSGLFPTVLLLVSNTAAYLVDPRCFAGWQRQENDISFGRHLNKVRSGLRLARFSDHGLAGELQRMVNDGPDDNSNPPLRDRISSLEDTLAMFVEEETKRQQLSPRPPGIPPPLSMLESDDNDLSESWNTGDHTSNELIDQAEQVLRELRARLDEETEALRVAEAALEQSIREEDILRRAEEALQRSRQSAEKRKHAAIRRTTEAVAAAEQIRTESEQVANALEVQASGSFSNFTEEELQYAQDLGLDTTLFETSNQSDLREEYRSTIKIPTVLGTTTSRLSPEKVADKSIAHEGFPTLYNWIQEAGGVVKGQIKNSARFEDGVSIATSVVSTVACQGTIIETISGSKYYLAQPLSPEIQVDSAPSIQSLLDDTLPPGMTMPVDSIPEQVEASLLDLSNSDDISVGSRVANYVPENTESVQPNRATFSLSDIFRFGNARRRTTTPPSTGMQQTSGVPVLSDWTANPDGTITGTVCGSSKLRDGDVVTTSKIVEGVPGSDQRVATASGSVYFLA